MENKGQVGIGTLLIVFISVIVGLILLTSMTGFISQTTDTGTIANEQLTLGAVNATIDLQAGSTFFEQTISLVIPRREASKRNAISLLISGQKELHVIALDSNGLYWSLGTLEGVQASNIESTSGVAKADGSNYTITLLGKERFQAETIDASVITALALV